MNDQVKVTGKTPQNIAYSIIVYARVSDESIHFVFMYTTNHILLVLSIKKRGKSGR